MATRGLDAAGEFLAKPIDFDLLKGDVGNYPMSLTEDCIARSNGRFRLSHRSKPREGRSEAGTWLAVEADRAERPVRVDSGPLKLLGDGSPVQSRARHTAWVLMRR